MSSRLATILCAVLAVSATACDDAERGRTERAVVGGVAAEVGQFPTTVGIFHIGYCTGTVIAPEWVLTAGHCLHPGLLGIASQADVTSRTTVTIDSVNLKMQGGTVLEITDTIFNPAFDPDGFGVNDVGLIRLAEPLTDRTPTPINRFRDDAPIGIAVTQVGFGADIPGAVSSAGQLNFIEQSSVSCSLFGPSDDDLLCFDETDGTGRCRGDSGGASLANIGGVERLVSSTSFGDGPCMEFHADMRVDTQLDFLFAEAPELQCQADGVCNEDCDSGGLPRDDDCEPADTGGCSAAGGPTTGGLLAILLFLGLLRVYPPKRSSKGPKVPVL